MPLYLAARWLTTSHVTFGYKNALRAVRAAPARATAILEFLDSTHVACAARLGWSPDLVSAEQPPAATSA